MKQARLLRSFFLLPKAIRIKTYIPEDITTSYPIVDNGEKLLSVKDFFTKNNIDIIINPPIEIGENVEDMMLRETPLNRLILAAKSLPQSIIFSLSEGFRPLWLQEKFFNEIYEDIKNKNLKMDDKEIWHQTTKYVADPTLCPPHNTGGAIDITIVEKNGKQIDMGAPMNDISKKVNMFSKGLTKQQKANRKILFSSLTNVGFINLATEWWHYSYGDQYWAIVNKKKNAIYGKVLQ